jgi:hypothetical protein
LFPELCTRWARNLKNIALKSKTQFVKQERNMQDAIALFNYLKRIALRQLMLRLQVFTKRFLSAKNATATFLNKKVLSQVNSKVRRIRTRFFRLPSAGLNHHGIRATLNKGHHCDNRQRSSLLCLSSFLLYDGCLDLT